MDEHLLRIGCLIDIARCQSEISEILKTNNPERFKERLLGMTSGERGDLFRWIKGLEAAVRELRTTVLDLS